MNRIITPIKALPFVFALVLAACGTSGGEATNTEEPTVSTELSTSSESTASTTDSSGSVESEVDVEVDTDCMTAVGNASIVCLEDATVIESNGLPDHEVMVGIEAGAWNGQWPTAQDYTGENAFVIPASTLLVDDPHYFVRNVAGVTANGVPIFLPTSPGRAGSAECLDLPYPEDAVGDDECLRDPVVDGEMDECGGHTGRGDDYHYHASPECLLEKLDVSEVAGYMLDGIPVYAEPIEGSTPYGECGAYVSPEGVIHYAFTDEYPYVTQCLLGSYEEGPRTSGSETDTGGYSSEELGSITGYEVSDDGCQVMTFASGIELVHCDDH